jgi:hypothetical protein
MGHHLVLGELTDYLSGRRLPDTHDERHRQAVARFLVEDRGFARDGLRAGVPLTVSAGEKRAQVRVDFVVPVGPRVGMVIKYGPGSLTTRHRIALALAYLLGAFRVPICVVTNGRDADVLTSADGRVVARGFAGIPSRLDLEARLGRQTPVRVAARQAELAGRIVYAYEVDDRCPCDDTVCERVW